MKINILHVIVGLDVGGAEMMLYKLVTNSNSKKYNNIVVSLTQNNKLTPMFKNEGIKVIHLHLTKNPLSLLSCVKNLRKIFKQYRPRIVHSWMYHSNIISYFSLVGLNPCIVWNVRHTIHDIKHEKHMTKLVIYMNALFSRFISLIIFNSKKSLESHEKIGYKGEEHHVIGNGFDTKKFKPTQYSRERLKKELKIPQENYVIGMVARYHPIKGYEVFIEAATLLTKKIRNVDFVLVGKEIDYNNEVLLESLKNNKIQNRFHLLGPRDDVNKILSAVDIATLTSHSESFPNVIGEAMSSGTICLSTDVGGVRNLISDYGVIVSVNDPRKVCDGWERILSMDINEKRTLEEKSRIHIIENYSIDSISTIYNEHYQNLL